MAGLKKRMIQKLISIKFLDGYKLEEILEDDNQISNFLKKYNLSHPHDPKYREYKNNTIYVSKNLLAYLKNFLKD